jgi:hypothetical protein
VRRLLGLLFILVLAMVGVPAGEASAGGWAVTTLDAVPTPQVGKVESVGFVIRQHGVTPVRLDADVGVEVRSASGRVDYFPATPSGAVGHYVAEVVFREPGAATWAIHQGWFGPQDLGIVAVGSGAATSATVTDRDWPAVVRLGLPVLAFAAAAVAVGDAARGRRRVPA